MTIRQTAEETVDQYSRRFKKILRKCNTNNLVPAALQVRMYLYGLHSLITPLVSVHNPADLDTAITRAKAVETGYNYVPSKPMMVQMPPTVTGNPPLAQNTTFTPNPVPENAESKIDALTKQMEQLTLNYANLTSVMLAKEKPQRRTDDRPRRTSDNPIICYKCNQEGHIARNCTTRPPRNSNPGRGRPARNNNNRFNTRTFNLNYLDNDDSEAEVYLNNTRARSYNTES